MEDTQNEECLPSETRFVADRCDIWRAAYLMMKDCGINDPDAADVLDVAIFIAGDGLRSDD